MESARPASSATLETYTTFRVHLDLEYERSLSKLIEGEIIPRLMVAHAGEAPQTNPIVTGTVIALEEVEAFVPLVLQLEADTLLHHVDAILARGIPFESVLVDRVPTRGVAYLGPPDFRRQFEPGMYR
eukprot:gene7506-9612_t